MKTGFKLKYTVTRVQIDNNKKLRTALNQTFGAELNELPYNKQRSDELRELRTDLSNLVIGGEEYISTLNRINQLQAQLPDIDPLDPTGRKADIRSRLGTIGRFGGETDPVAGY